MGILNEDKFILNNKCVQWYGLLFQYMVYFNLSGYNM